MSIIGRTCKFSEWGTGASQACRSTNPKSPEKCSFVDSICSGGLNLSLQAQCEFVEPITINTLTGEEIK